MPFPDAIGQFTQESSVMGAQDGMKAGGMVNVVTKSGTNSFHGNAFEYIRNDFIDASSFFSDSHDRLHQNEYGGTIGGPVWIPKLYNGKNRLFFFAGFHRLTYDDVASNQTATVPTALELAGDFRAENGDPINGTAPNSLCSTKPLAQLQLVDPVTGALVENSAGQGNVYQTTPNWNTNSQAVLAYLPKVVPLKSGLDVCGGIQYAIPNEHYDKQFITREDYNIGAKDNLYGRYFLDSYQVPSFYSPTNILLTSQAGNPEERVQTGTIGENHIFTSNLVNSAHIAVMRRYHTRAYNSADISACTGAGFTIIATCAVPNGLQLSTGGNGIGGFSIGNSTNSPAHFNDNTGVIDDDLTWVKGRHLINFGGEYVRNQLNISNTFTGVGVYGFGSNYSSYGPYGSKGTAANNPNAGITALGNGQLDFLEGAMNDFSQGKEQQNALRSTIPALYVQDTFHTTKKLTLVFGIRWDPNYMPTDVFNRGATFSNAAFLAGTQSTVYPNAPAGVLFYGDPGVSKSFTRSSPNQWDPNIGFTYDPLGDGKTVIRGGAEYIYDTANTFTAQREQQNPPFATGVNQSTNTYDPLSDPWLTKPSDIPTPSAGAGAVNSGSLTANPFPTQASFSGRPTAAAALFPKNSTWIVLPNQFHIATYAQWNASIQHDFPHGWQVQLQYVGSKGTHEEGGMPLDPVVWIPGVSTGIAGPKNCNVSIGGTNYYLGEPGSSAVPAAGVNCSSTSNNSQRGMLTLENPAQGVLFGDGTTSDIVGDFAFSTYEGGIFSVNHRFSSVFSMFANYTWSKCLNIEDNQGDISGVQVENPNNPKADYGPCGSNLQNVFNTSIVANSKFHFSNSLANYLINNWTFGALSSAHSGGVQNVTPGSDISLTAMNNDRANLIPGIPVYQKVKFQSAGGEANREFLNPNAFSIPSPTAPTSAFPTYGNISRNEFHGLPFVSFDAQISRYWPIHENLKLNTEIQAFDVLNHPDFSCCSSTSVASSSFGQVSSTAYGPRQFQGSLQLIF
jgi:hypothetical protein